MNGAFLIPRCPTCLAGILVDRELARLEHTLRVLATSPSLTTGDLAAFWRQANEAMQEEGVTGRYREYCPMRTLGQYRPGMVQPEVPKPATEPKCWHFSLRAAC